MAKCPFQLYRLAFIAPQISFSANRFAIGLFKITSGLEILKTTRVVVRVSVSVGEVVFRGASRRLCLQPTSSSGARQPGNLPARQPARQPGSSASVTSYGCASVTVKVSVKIICFASVSAKVSVQITGFASVSAKVSVKIIDFASVSVMVAANRVRVRLLYP